ncbi:MAG: hypothetical protein RSA94_01655 [Mucinivorans sp.]
MTLEEIFDIEAMNQAEIHLFRQGMFFRAFEKSCVALQRVAKYQILKKRAVGLGVEYIYSGFPCSVLEKVIGKRRFTFVEQDHVIVEAVGVGDEELARRKRETMFSVGLQNSAKPVAGSMLEPIAGLAAASCAKIEPAESQEARAEIVTEAESEVMSKQKTLMEMIRRFDVENADGQACRMLLGMIKSAL